MHPIERQTPFFFLLNYQMLTVHGRLQLFNQDDVMFLCLDAVAKGH